MKVCGVRDTWKELHSEIQLLSANLQTSNNMKMQIARKFQHHNGEGAADRPRRSDAQKLINDAVISALWGRLCRERKDGDAPADAGVEAGIKLGNLTIISMVVRPCNHRRFPF